MVADRKLPCLSSAGHVSLPHNLLTIRHHHLPTLANLSAGSGTMSFAIGKGTAASFIVLTTALEAHQRARAAREIIDDEGMVVVGRDGQPRAHPLCSVERDARAAFQRTFKQLGIKL